MPTYDYLCEACGHEFELFQAMSAPVKRKCPECEKKTLKRLIGTGAGVIFKGSGFYETDYRSSSYKKGAEAEKKAAEGKADGGKKSDDGAKKSDDVSKKSKGSSGSSESTSPAKKTAKKRDEQ